MLSLTGCFTGVESTPRITAGDVARQSAAVATAEDRYLADVKGEPVADWQPGKKLTVTDERLKMVTQRRGDSFNGPWKGRELTFAGLRPAKSITGEEALDFYFTLEGDTIVYRNGGNRAEVLKNEAGTAVPFTVEQTMVERGRALMKGKHYYTLTGIWRDSTDQVAAGRKYVEVEVTDVRAGSADYPLMVEIRETEGESPMSGMLLLTPRPDARGSRTFASQLSLSNPRDKYPTVEPENWKLIADGKVRPGMTKLECRLALGAPTDLDRGAGYSSVYEKWVYGNGVVLIFEDGKLK